MEAKAKARFVRMSAHKVRRVAELIKGKNVEEALNILTFTPQAAASVLEKTLKSATANALNAEGTAKLKVEDMWIRKIMVDGGPIMKRIRPMGMGRAYRIRKRINHITVVITDGKEREEEK
jgi:large subunit ribosomal protein L22